MGGVILTPVKGRRGTFTWCLFDWGCLLLSDSTIGRALL